MGTLLELLSSPIILIAALVIGCLGEVAKRTINAKLLEKEVIAWRDRPISYRDNAKSEPPPPKPPTWKIVWYTTLPAHPVVAGFLLGLIPWLPAVETLTKPGFEFAAHLGTYTFAGVVAKVGYDTLVSTVKRMIRQKADEPATPDA